MKNPAWYAEREQLFSKKELLPLTVPIQSLEERDRRWAALREKMHLHALDALVLAGTDFNASMGMANIRYVTQIGTMLGAYVVFPRVGDPTVFYGAPHMHLPGPWQQVPGHWVEDVRPMNGVQGVLDVLAQHGLGEGRLGYVGYRDMLVPETQIPAFFLDQLRRDLPRATLTDATPLLDEMRSVKSDEEIRFLRRAGEIARKRIQRLAVTAREGATEADVWAAMEHEMIVNGGEPSSFTMLSSGPVTGPDGERYVAGLLHGAEVPFTATMRRLTEGDLIVCEFHTSYGGYLAATEFSVFLGEAPPELHRLHQAGVHVIRMARDLFVPGRPLREIYTAFHDYAAGEGIDFVELGFHGHGLSSPEFPAVVYRETEGQLLNRRGLGDVRLRENMVFGLNVDLHDPLWRKDVGLMIGDMVRVTPDGAEYLCDIPLDLFEVPAR
ncbi:M24 family metallopeptidase [Amycolatopsis pithecellobii]|uniref:M24 family metallopeptidase n=1 Tax=Amycolatopsis pithecellobii TaxID=664692 RepID=A0A6N7YI43_9PSEU|nr:Xaa-Pro peptidase family protein [Amycolatopsis pithecellobii]MTD52565.1 M24 family metallopeptidase [Amycolatopsis pithecellobii]